MTIEQLLQRHSTAKEEDTVEPDAVDDQGAYGLVRAPRERALMVELRKKDGSILAVPYAGIEQLTFNPSDGITIFSGGREISVTGKNLNSNLGGKVNLFSGLTRHRVAWIQEWSRSAKPDETVVDRIEF